MAPTRLRCGTEERELELSWLEHACGIRKAECGSRVGVALASTSSARLSRSNATTSKFGPSTCSSNRVSANKCASSRATRNSRVVSFAKNALPWQGLRGVVHPKPRGHSGGEVRSAAAAPTDRGGGRSASIVDAAGHLSTSFACNVRSRQWLSQLVSSWFFSMFCKSPSCHLHYYLELCDRLAREREMIVAIVLSFFDERSDSKWPAPSPSSPAQLFPLCLPSSSFGTG